MLSTCPSGLSHFQYWLIVEKWRFVVLMLRRATGRLDRSARSIASSGSTILERLFPWLAGRRSSHSRNRPASCPLKSLSCDMDTSTPAPRTTDPLPPDRTGHDDR